MAAYQRPPFATYLLPSFAFPFRRRQSSSASASSEGASAISISSTPGTTPPSSPPHISFLNAPSSPSQDKGKGKSLLSEALQNTLTSPPTHLTRSQPNTLRCGTCATDIAFTSQIVSKGFTGRHGRAYLVAGPLRPPAVALKSDKYETQLINTRVGRHTNRELLTGHHVVADITCVVCSTVLGWKYVDAKAQSQKYKIGKFIVEMKRVVSCVSWEDVNEGVEGSMDNLNEGLETGEDCEVDFDSEDEDECEDLFAGIWNAEAIAKKRGKRVGRKGHFA